MQKIKITTSDAFDGVIRPKKVRSGFPKKETIISSFKILGVSLLSFVLLLSVSSIGGTVSYFNDVEEVIGNYLRADPISFQVSPASTQLDLSQETKITLEMLPDAISDPVQYFVSAKEISGDTEFCKSIHVVGTWPFPVDGNLVGTITDTSNSTGSWTLTLSVPESQKTANASCNIELTYFGWRDGYDLSHSFSDTKKVNLFVYIPSDFLSVETTEVSTSQSFVAPTSPSMEGEIEDEKVENEEERSLEKSKKEDIKDEKIKEDKESEIGDNELVVEEESENNLSEGNSEIKTMDDTNKDPKEVVSPQVEGEVPAEEVATPPQAPEGEAPASDSAPEAEAPQGN